MKLILFTVLLSFGSSAFSQDLQNENFATQAHLESAALTTTGTVAGSSVCITAPASVANLGVGQYVYDRSVPGRIPTNTKIVGLPGTCGTGNIQMSAAAITNGANDTLAFGGNMSQLLNDDKIYLKANGINDTLFNAITNGLIGGGGGSTGGALDTYVNIPRIAIPANSTITSRSKIVDKTADLSVKWGIDRYNIAQLVPMQGEHSSVNATSPVYGMTNDADNAIRFVGNWQYQSVCRIKIGDNSDQPTFEDCVQSYSLNDYVEISFYGTGIDALLSAAEYANTGADVRVSVDGAAEVVVLNNTYTYPLTGTVSGGAPLHRHRNTPFNLAKGLSQGYHIVKLRNASANSVPMSFLGWQVLNSTTSITIASGSTTGANSNTTNTTTSLSYNSGFAIGTLGTTGGRAIIYQNSSGGVQSAVNPVATSSTIFPTATSATHVTNNEEVVRHGNFSEMAYKSISASDFSVLSGNISSGSVTTNQAMGIDDDGTFILDGQQMFFAGGRGPNSGSGTTFYNAFLGLAATGTTGVAGYEITFVGSGLDVVMAPLAFAGQLTTVTLDGASLGTMPNTVNASSQVITIASGLPFGTHTVQFSTATSGVSYANDSFTLMDAVVYQPAMPNLPNGASLLADYDILANFTANTTVGSRFVSTGVIRRHALREVQYVSPTSGTSSVAVNNGNAGVYFNGPVGGVGLASNSNSGDYYNYTFFGSGFCAVHSPLPGGSSGATLFQVDGLTLTTGNFSSLVVTAPSGSYNTGTGAFTTTTGYGVQWCFTGLGLGHHTLTIPATIALDAIDTIGGVFSYKEGMPGMPNAWSGSQGIYDDRKPAKTIANSQMLYLVNKSMNIGTSTCNGGTNNSLTANILGPCVGGYLNFRSSGKPGTLTMTRPSAYLIDSTIPYVDIDTSSGTTGLTTRVMNLSPGFHSIIGIGFGNSINQMSYQEAETR